MPERGRSTYIPGWKPSRAYSYDSEARKRPTYTPNYTPKTATPLRTVEVGDKPGSVVRQTVYTPSDYTPSDMKRYSADSSNAAIASLNARQAPSLPRIIPPTPRGSLNARGSGQNYGGGSRSRSSGSSSKALNYASQLNQGLARSYSSVPQVGGYTIPGSRPYESPDRWSEQQARTQIFPTAITKGQQEANLMAAQGTNPALATGLGFAQDVAEGVVGGKLVPSFFKPSVSQAPVFTPTMPGGGSLVARAGQAVSNIGQGGINLVKNNPVKSLGLGIGGGLAYGLTRDQGVQGPSIPETVPAQVDQATETSIGRPAPTGGLPTITPPGNNMTTNTQNTFDQDAFMQAMYNANRPGYLGQGNAMDGRIVPGTGIPDNTMSQSPTQNVAQPELPPGNLFNPVQERQEMFDYLDQLGQKSAAAAAAVYSQMSAEFARVEEDLRKQYEQQGTVMDPATLAALKEMRAEVDRRRQGLMEEMNRRGLLQSGIWLQEENRILGNQLTAEEKLLAGRVADIQNRMTDALRQLGTQRINTMGQLTQNQMQSNQWMQGQQINAMNTLNSRNDQWNQWWQGQLNQQRQDAESKRRWDYEQQWNRDKQISDWSKTIPEGYPGAGQPTWEATTKQREMDIQAQKARTSGSTSSNSATRDYIGAISFYQDLDSALEGYRQNIANMQRDGVDLNAVLQNIYARFGVR